MNKKDDSFGLSSRGNEIQRLSRLITQSREERIAQIRGMLDSGTYQVSSFEIARKMIESHRR
jgi:anti-sigma28 factor (negative regulator of flagellin synthesis)